MPPRSVVSAVESPIECLSGIWRFTHEPDGYSQARSLPGHLLHLIISGKYRLRTNGREYDIQKGDIIYYHETEDVEWLGNEGPVVFYSVGFLARKLDPLPFDHRVFSSTSEQRDAFSEIYEASLAAPDIHRDLIMFAALASLLGSFETEGISGESSMAVMPWWRIEATLRSHKQFRASLDDLADMGHMSRATVVRSCRRATGLSPGERLRVVRMQEAEGLLAFSHLSITQIAEYLGYPRLNEFSREF